jgi:hypothetical protein
MFQPHCPQSPNNEFIKKSVILNKMGPMRPYFFYSLILLLFACNGKPEPGGAETVGKDSLATGKVKLLIKDSIPVYIKTDSLAGKIRTNAAG